MNTVDEATLKAKEKAALDLFLFRPKGIEQGSSAGKRREGVEFAEKMTKHLSRAGYKIKTVIGKSTDGKRLDGNAHERLAFAMMNHAMSPLENDQALVVAMNDAFVETKPAFYADILAMAASLNAKSAGSPIIVLGTKKAYKQYFSRWRRDEAARTLQSR